MRNINSTTAYRNRETIDTYITTLRALAETCESGTLKDDLIRERIVCGVRDQGIRRKLLQECGLTLSKCVDICLVNEATYAKLKDMAPSQTTEQEVNEVNQKESPNPLRAPFFRDRVSGGTEPKK